MLESFKNSFATANSFFELCTWIDTEIKEELAGTFVQFLHLIAVDKFNKMSYLISDGLWILTIKGLIYLYEHFMSVACCVSAAIYYLDCQTIECLLIRCAYKNDLVLLFDYTFIHDLGKCKELQWIYH